MQTTSFFKNTEVSYFVKDDLSFIALRKKQTISLSFKSLQKIMRMKLKKKYEQEKSKLQLHC